MRQRAASSARSAGLSRRALLLAAASAFAPPAAAGLPEVVAAARPALVAVGTYNPTDNPRFGFRGSGFAVGDGTLVVTNLHVLPPAEEPEQLARTAVLVVGEGQTRVPRAARVLGTDRRHDLALLRIEGAPLPTMALAPGTAREGQAIALMGFPIGGVLGYSPVTHGGIVSAITPMVLPVANARQMNAFAAAQLRDGAFDIYQLDATAYPGNSGGPVLDAETGQVLAVVNMVLVKAGRESALSNPTGITYAIPVEHVRALIAEHAAGQTR